MSTQTANLQVDVMAFLMPQDHARLLRKGETIPASLEAGFEQLGKLDPDWIWVVQSGREIKGVLLACPCHGAAFVWRIAIAPDLDNVAVLRLLRRFLSDLKQRGVKGYLTIVDPKVATQTRLMELIRKGGGQVVGNYTLMVGPTEGGVSLSRS
jgi:hypothetical protein